MTRPAGVREISQGGWNGERRRGVNQNESKEGCSDAQRNVRLVGGAKDSRPPSMLVRNAAHGRWWEVV